MVKMKGKRYPALTINSRRSIGISTPFPITLRVALHAAGKKPKKDLVTPILTLRDLIELRIHIVDVPWDRSNYTYL